MHYQLPVPCMQPSFFHAMGSTRPPLVNCRVSTGAKSNQETSSKTKNAHILWLSNPTSGNLSHGSLIHEQNGTWTKLFRAALLNDVKHWNNSNIH